MEKSGSDLENLQEFWKCIQKFQKQIDKKHLPKLHLLGSSPPWIFTIVIFFISSFPFKSRGKHSQFFSIKLSSPPSPAPLPNPCGAHFQKILCKLAFPR